MIFEVIGKSAQWLVVVTVLSVFLFVRSANLLIWERLASAIVSAGLAFGLSEELAPIFRDSEIAAAIAVMILGPMLLGMLLNIGGDEKYLKHVLKAWVEKSLGVEVNDDDDGSETKA